MTYGQYCDKLADAIHTLNPDAVPDELPGDSLHENAMYGFGPLQRALKQALAIARRQRATLLAQLTEQAQADGDYDK